MDKVILTKEELRVLVKFIHSRGFREPSVVMDILDHFACKVEEKMLAAPSLTLDQAMQDAHRDFGVSGFRNLAASHQGQFEIRQKRIFKKNAVDLAGNFPFVFGILTTAAFYYKGYTWATDNHVSLLWDSNIFLLCIWLVAIAGALRVHAGIPKKYLKTASEAGYTNTVWAWLANGLFFTSVQIFPGLNGPLPAAYTTFVFVYLITYYIVEYKTINKLFENYKDVEHMLLELE